MTANPVSSPKKSSSTVRDVALASHVPDDAPLPPTKPRTAFVTFCTEIRPAMEKNGEVRPSEERSDELATPSLVKKITRDHNSVQYTPPPSPPLQSIIIPHPNLFRDSLRSSQFQGLTFNQGTSKISAFWKKKTKEEVRSDDERSDELATLALRTKATRACTFMQDAPLP